MIDQQEAIRLVAASLVGFLIGVAFCAWQIAKPSGDRDD